MSLRVLASALLLSQMVIEAQEIPAEDFHAVMEEKYPEYKKEVITVTTEDGYILPLFHIWKEGVSGNKQPVMFQHGGSMDGTSWLTTWEQPAVAIQMVDDGHHAYIGNNRGTPNAYGHTTLDPIVDAQ